MTEKNKALEILNKLEKDIEGLEKGFKAKIIAIDSASSNEYYDSNQYENRQGLKITFVTEDESQEWDEFFSIPDTPAGLMNKDCRIAKLKKKYGQTPYVGMIVDAKVDDNGFVKVVL